MLPLAIGTNFEDDIKDDAQAYNGLGGDVVRRLMLDDSTPPYDGSKVIKQVNCRALFCMLNFIVSHNIDR